MIVQRYSDRAAVSALSQWLGVPRSTLYCLVQENVATNPASIRCITARWFLMKRLLIR